MQKIVPNLWFDGRVEEALDFYTSIFPHSSVKGISHYPQDHPQVGEIMVATFEIGGQEFTIINGGPQFQHSPAISLLVNCVDQAEVDHLWERLGDGGEYQQCGWLTDRFGISWQIVPTTLGKLMDKASPEQAARVMTVLWSMGKLNIAELEEAFNGG